MSGRSDHCERRPCFHCDRGEFDECCAHKGCFGCTTRRCADDLARASVHTAEFAERIKNGELLRSGEAPLTNTERMLAEAVEEMAHHLACLANVVGRRGF